VDIIQEHVHNQKEKTMSEFTSKLFDTFEEAQSKIDADILLSSYNDWMCPVINGLCPKDCIAWKPSEVAESIRNPGKFIIKYGECVHPTISEIMRLRGNGPRITSRNEVKTNIIIQNRSEVTSSCKNRCGVQIDQPVMEE
jgi:hypothetical protein